MSPGPLTMTSVTLFSPGNDVRKVKFRCQAEQDIEVAQTPVSVEDENLQSQAGQGVTKVGHDVGFADASLAAGYGDNPGSGSPPCSELPLLPSAVFLQSVW